MIKTYNDPLDRPQRYKLTSPQLRELLQCTQGWVNNKCERPNDPMPHVVCKNKQAITRYFDPKEVLEWFGRQGIDKQA